MPADRPVLAHAPRPVPNRPVSGRAWRCVACGLFFGSTATRHRPPVCTACHSGAIYAVSAPVKLLNF